MAQFKRKPISHKTKYLASNSYQQEAKSIFTKKTDRINMLSLLVVFSLIVTHIKSFFATYQKLHLSSEQTTRIT